MRKPIFLTVALILGLASTQRCWADANTEGIKYFRKGDYVNAERFYRQALSEATSNEELGAAYRNLSILYNAQGKDGSEFSKKADEFDPPAQLQRVRGSDGSVMMKNDQSKFARPLAQPKFDIPAPEPKGESAMPFVYSNTNTTTTVTGGGFSMGQPVGRGGILGGGFNTRTVTEPLPGFGNGNGGLIYSRSGPDGTVQTQTNMPIVLPVPNSNAPPVIINAPGPDVYSSQQGQDGSKSTIIMRTE